MSDRSQQKILDALSVYADRSATQLAQMTGVGPGSLYPALMILEQAGTIQSRWFNEDGAFPRKRVYRLKDRQ